MHERPDFSAARAGPIAFYFNRQEVGRHNLMFLHGALGSADRILDLADGFGDSNLLFCDLRGHGRSDRTESGYNPTEMARDLIVPVRETFEEAPFTVIA